MPFVYLASEAAFMLWYLRRSSMLDACTDPMPQPTSTGCTPQQTFGKVLRELRGRSRDEVAALLSMWFKGAPCGDVCEGNVADWIAYSFFGTTWCNLLQSQQQELCAMVEQLQQLLHTRLPKGHNPRVAFMAHLSEPLRHVYRPLAFYACMELLAGLTWVMLAAVGFRRCTVLGTTTYYRAGDARQPPVLVLHGLGVGLIAYSGFLFSLVSTGRPIIAVELAHVSQRISDVLTIDEVVSRLVLLLGELHVPVVDIVAHSYGTLVASALLKQYPAAVGSLTLVDPVCFNMWLPRLLRALYYTFPDTGNALADWMMFLAARELHCAAALSRRFDWQVANCWPELLPEHTLVVLSEADILVDSARMHKWLEALACVRVLLLEGTAHAGFLLDHGQQATIVAHVEHMLRMRQC